MRAATSTFLTSLANSLPRLASTTAFLCLVVAHLECPLISCSEPFRRNTHAHAHHRSAPGETRWPADGAGGRRRSYRRRAQSPPAPTPWPALRPTRPTAPG